MIEKQQLVDRKYIILSIRGKLMESILTKELQTGLQEVDKIFRSSLLPWWAGISAYLPYVEKDLGFKVLPAMVINAYQYLGLDRELSIQMANLFMTIDFASKIHILVKDDDEGQKRSQEMQFTILIGDYIFGRVLKLLVETHTDHLLYMFATMIGRINEGLIIEYKFNCSLEQVLNQTRAPLYHDAFLSAAKIAHLAPGTAEIYAEIGQNLGIALELFNKYGHKTSWHTYLNKAKELLPLLNKNEISQLRSLENLICEMDKNWEVA
jgi:geranylgeranyl pyrophosphate synthase